MKTSVNTAADHQALRRAMNLSLGVGLFMFGLKAGAYLLTKSAAILSDAAESVVHMAAVVFAAYSLRLSHRPADRNHLYGHAKISFFSAGFEGAMIVIAALYILYESVHKWAAGLELQHLGIGTALTAAAAVINGALGAYLVSLGRREHSVILEANGRHVLTDCWTSLAVLTGLALVLITHWQPFDSLCGILMACNILWSGAGLMKSAFFGLMDTSDPATNAKLVKILDEETQRRGLAYHELRHRNMGDAHWVEVHLLFPEGISLRDAHRSATEIERRIEDSLEPRANVTTHLECANDHAAMHGDGPTASGAVGRWNK